MREDPRHPGKGQGQCLVVRGKLVPYSWGWCTVFLAVRKLQPIAGSVTCMQLRCAIMETVVSSNQYSGHGIRLWIITWYECPTPMHFSAMASSDIPSRNAPGWQFIVHDFATLADRPYLLKRPTSTFILFWSQSKSRETPMPSSE